LTCPASSDANGRASRQDIRDLIEKEMATTMVVCRGPVWDYVDPEPVRAIRNSLAKILLHGLIWPGRFLLTKSR
jgi:hypothetical protein